MADKTIELENKLNAIKLFKLGLKVNIVSTFTKLNYAPLRNLYKATFDESPKSGPLPEVNGILDTRRLLIEGAIFIKAYIFIGKNVLNEIDANALIKAYEHYKKLRISFGIAADSRWHLIDINHAWVLARNLITGQIKLKKCPNGCDYIEVSQQYNRLECQLCKLIHRENVLNKQGKPLSD